MLTMATGVEHLLWVPSDLWDGKSCQDSRDYYESSSQMACYLCCGCPWPSKSPTQYALLQRKHEKKQWRFPSDGCGHKGPLYTHASWDLSFTVAWQRSFRTWLGLKLPKKTAPTGLLPVNGATRRTRIVHRQLFRTSFRNSKSIIISCLTFWCLIRCVITPVVWAELLRSFIRNHFSHISLQLQGTPVGWGSDSQEKSYSYLYRHELKIIAICSSLSGCGPGCHLHSRGWPHT